MRRRLHHLRFAPAVVFALLALALVGLWARSYLWFDSAYFSIGDSVVAGGSNRGVLMFMFVDESRPGDAPKHSWHSYRLSKDKRIRTWTNETLLGFGYAPRDVIGPAHLYVPIWFLLIVAACLSAVFAHKPITRFTVRGLLVTTTLLAGLLGLAEYAL